MIKKNILNQMLVLSLLASLGFVALFCSASPALAATAPALGTASSFAVLSATPDVTNVGPTIVTGDLGVSPAAAVIGFPPGIVIGTTNAGDATAASAQLANTAAYGNLAGQVCTTTFAVPTDLAGMTLVPGVYCFASSASNTGLLQLDALGDPNAVWVFKIVSTLITGSGSTVAVINGGQDCNVFWQVGSSATLGTTTTFIGNILALTSIDMLTGATLSGRAFVQTGRVTLGSNAVTLCSLALPPPVGTPTLGKGFIPAAINAGADSTLTITLTNPNVAAATIISLTDNLPLGVMVATSPVASNTCGGTFTPSSGDTILTMTGGSIPGGLPGTCTLTVNVTAAAAGSYINTLAIGDLVTSIGVNAAPAIATLTVNPLGGPSAPTVGKTFAPVSITAGGVSTLIITLSNPNDTAASITSFLDNLPTGLVIADVKKINASTTCGGTLTAVEGTSTVSLTGGSIPAGTFGSPGTCTITVFVTAVTAGSYVNTLPVNSLVTSNGNNTAPIIATLTVTQVLITQTTDIPTLNEWGAIFFMMIAGLGSVYYLKKYKRV